MFWVLKVRFEVERRETSLEEKNDEICVKCPKGHKLDFYKRLRLPPFESWACDTGAFQNPKELVPYREEKHKRMYGILDHEEWYCLRGKNSF